MGKRFHHLIHQHLIQQSLTRGLVFNTTKKARWQTNHACAQPFHPVNWQPWTAVSALLGLIIIAAGVLDTPLSGSVMCWTHRVGVMVCHLTCFGCTLFHPQAAAVFVTMDTDMDKSIWSVIRVKIRCTKLYSFISEKTLCLHLLSYCGSCNMPNC